jgi:hypothetical protein
MNMIKKPSKESRWRQLLVPNEPPVGKLLKQIKKEAGE